MEVEKIVSTVRCPQLLLPAGNDADMVKEDGEVIKLLREKEFGDDCSVHTYPEMAHGFMCRGDVQRPEVG